MCEYCSLLNSDRVVARDNDIAIVWAKTTAPAALVVSTTHTPLSELTASVQTRLLATANMLSSLLFDNLGMHGTNIIGRDAEHAQYLVVGRMENDGLDLRWQPKSVSQSDLAEVAKKIKDETWYVGKREAPAKERAIIEKPQRSPHGSPLPQPHADNADSGNETATEAANDLQKNIKHGPTDEHNYLIRQLTRRR